MNVTFSPEQTEELDAARETVAFKLGFIVNVKSEHPEGPVEPFFGTILQT